MASRPDFVIRPVRSGSRRLPIAVFCDGWTYHQSSLRADAAKRSALAASGKYWVWSVTREDVKAALAEDLKTDLESPLVSLSRNSQVGEVEQRPQAFADNSVAQLLRLLYLKEDGQADPVRVELRKNARWATFRMVEFGKAESQMLQTEMAAVWSCLPDAMREQPPNSLAAGGKEGSSPVVRCWFPSKADAHLVPGVVIHDDQTADLPEQQRQLAWRRWLWVFNTLQAIPGFLLVTRHGLEGRDYEALVPREPAMAVPGREQEGYQREWLEAQESVLEAMKPGAAKLKEAGLAPPTVGYEHAGEGGIVGPEAEMAWTRERLVVLRGDQREFVDGWKSLGWDTVVAEGDWEELVMKKLRTEATA